eukprot:289712-Alexandrium_andersonii.AAC.1
MCIRDRRSRFGIGTFTYCTSGTFASRPPPLAPPAAAAPRERFEPQRCFIAGWSTWNDTTTQLSPDECDALVARVAVEVSEEWKASCSRGIKLRASSTVALESLSPPATDVGPLP